MIMLLTIKNIIIRSGRSFLFMRVDLAGKIVEIPDDYDPRNEPGEYMCERHRAYFKIKLQKWLDEISQKLKAENIDDENADYRSTDESDRMVMEASTITELRSKDRLRKLARKIEEFIGKIDADTYGFCEESGEEIGINRLMMRPVARYCVEIQEKKDREEREREFIQQNNDERYKRGDK